MAQLRLLIAEDDIGAGEALRAAFLGERYEVVWVQNGEEARRVFRAGGWDCVLTDIVMPEMDGIELARRAGAIDSKLRIMFITGFAAVALNARGTRLPDTKVLSKPFHLRDLVLEINKLLAA